MARKILLADDSVTAQNMGRKILSDAGYDVVTVNNGSAALKRVAELKPDLIVLDVYMPGYSGLEVCQRLKDSPETEHIPVLLTVGKLEPFKPEEARRVGANAHIIKPFEASELLTALARMEDRMVPTATGVERFTGEGPSRKSESEGEADTSWKSRLRFPSKKKKEEPEPEPDIDVVGALSFRNFRRGKSKAASSATEKGAPPLEPGVVPRDITPEELDALSALAAKLDAGTSGETEETVELMVEKATPVEAKAESEVATPAPEEKTAGEVEVPHAEPQSDAETSATDALAEAIAAVVATEPVALSETQLTETVHVETLAAAEPAPVDREDEPIFATDASLIEPAPQEEKIEVAEVPAPASEAVAEVNLSEAIAIPATAEEQKAEQPKVEEASEVAETVTVEEPAAKVVPKMEETLTPEATIEAVPEVATAEETEVGAAPSEEELAQALRLLTPALGHADPSSTPRIETFVAAGAVLAEEAARVASEVPRWVAAAVALSPEEAALSLETEMFQTLLVGTVAADADSVPVVASPAAESEPAAEVKAETPTEAPSEPMATVPAAACETATLSVEAVLAEPNEAPATVVEEAPEEAAEEPLAATFADAMLHDEIEAVSAQSGAVPVSDAVLPAEEGEPPVVETPEVAISEVAAEGEEHMARERAKTGKSKWHQIRMAAAGTQDVLEAKQAEPAEEPQKAMAAAATAESAPAASAASTDASTIASIVDSVLADLRPKIVEEIAKKLAGK